MHASSLRTMVRIEDLRLVRARRALADARAAEGRAQVAHGQTQARVQAARGAWVQADTDFRAHAQCAQRAWLRELANQRLVDAVDAELRARDERNAAEHAAEAARVALGREEVRSGQVDGLHRAACAGERDGRETREEEDRTMTPVTA